MPETMNSSSIGFHITVLARLSILLTSHSYLFSAVVIHERAGTSPKLH